jgi:hypothetical protein
MEVGTWLESKSLRGMGAFGMVRMEVASIALRESRKRCSTDGTSTSNVVITPLGSMRARLASMTLRDPRWYSGSADREGLDDVLIPQM